MLTRARKSAMPLRRWATNAPFSQKAISQTGGAQSHNNMQPYLALNFCIALYGVFPPRS